MLDIDQFLSGSVNGANSTALTPVPEGEFQAVVKDVALRDFTYKKGPNAGLTGYALDITWEILDSQVKEQLKREPTVRQSMILELNGDALDMGEGRNVGLGKLRSALKQNDAGRPWAPSMLKGAVAIVQTKQRMDGDTIYTDVARVAAA
jgi:hypothetical protein